MLEDAFNQFAHINALRDAIIHRPLTEDPQGVLNATNLYRSSSINPEQTPVSADILTDIFHDLQKVNTIISFFVMKTSLPPEMVAVQDEMWNEVAASQKPWRYRPAQPAGRQGKSQKSGQKQ